MNEIKYKKPLSIEEQIDYLEKSKSVVYNKCSKEEARHILYKYNYINVISPFKYYFAEKDTKGNVIKDKNNCHIYKRKIDFGEYFQKYKNERNEYANESKQHMLKTISNFNNELDKYNSIFIFIINFGVNYNL